MNSIERFLATVERRPVDRPACWLGDPTPEAVPALCDFYKVNDIKELKESCGDDFYAVEILIILNIATLFLLLLTGI